MIFLSNTWHILLHHGQFKKKGSEHPRKKKPKTRNIFQKADYKQLEAQSNASKMYALY